MAERFNKQTLIERVLELDSVETKSAASDAVQVALDTIEETLISGEEVHLYNFGKFYTYTLASGKTVAKFKASTILNGKIPQ